jgi:mRNA interferase HigB
VAEEHGDLAGPLDVWYRIAKPAGWTSLEDARQDFPSADGVGEYTVFNIKGNEYRLISIIFYRTRKLSIRDVITHAEYDKGRWKKRLHRPQTLLTANSWRKRSLRSFSPKKRTIAL